MAHFTRTILTRAGSLQVYFNRIYIADLPYFHVSTTKDNQTYTCMLKRTTNGWELIDHEKCPDWLIALEDDLNRSIQEAERRG